MDEPATWCSPPPSGPNPQDTAVRTALEFPPQASPQPGVAVGTRFGTEVQNLQDKAVRTALVFSTIPEQRWALDLAPKCMLIPCRAVDEVW